MKPKIRYSLTALLLFLINADMFAAELGPTISYRIMEDGAQSLVQKLDWESEIKSIVDTVDLSEAKYSRGLEWQIYDSINGRIYFQEALFGLPFKAHYYDLSTRQLVDLPFDNYGEFQIIVSPQSKYIIIEYRHEPYDGSGTWNPNQNKTVILDGINLNILNEREALLINSGLYGSKRTFVSSDNKYLFNTEYLTMEEDRKETAVVIYSLPDLIPVDTFHIFNYGWEDKKFVMDVSQSSILVYGIKKDSSGNIPAGRYAFTLDGETGDLSSEIITLINTEKSHILLTPECDEIISIENGTGILRRYSMDNTEQLGEINGPENCFGPVFRDDGNLYIFDVDSLSHIVIDYKNDSILRTFEFNE